MKYDISAYLITCLTNMHVGSGEANYGVVDNLVQRDPISEVPIIHSSSLKGALREHFKDEWGEGDSRLNYVFGADPVRKKKEVKDSTEKENDKKKEPQVGYYKFFDANLVVLPVRSNVEPFYRATAEFLLKEVEEKAKALGKTGLSVSPITDYTVEEEKPKVVAANGQVILEDYTAVSGLQLKNSDNYLEDNLALFHKNTFKEFTKRLPVIARNQLENGESKNLWYEEVVPRESRFVFFVAKSEKYQEEFNKVIHNKTVQIGGNASIGYGFCKIEKIG